ncbi:MAG TPA: hypothetical protein VNT58_02320 [Gaiellaceae bacterium]|nr:hypothetical protein [Gaiellaceae bacterium]
MRLWSTVPRGTRDRVAGVVPTWAWRWLRQLREVELDRRWNAGLALRAAYPELVADAGLPLEAHEARVYSQNGEDGLIAHLLSQIGRTNGLFVEFGVEDGRECNTAALARLFGWRGLLMEADPACARAAADFFAAYPGVKVAHEMVTPETIDLLLRRHGIEGPIDVLSLDIDGNDLWVWRAIREIRPRLVVIEYNASFGPTRSVSVPYETGFDRYAKHASGFYHGASLTALAKVAAEKGYVLAGCDSRGSNAFFVEHDAATAAEVEAVEPAVAFRPLWERAHLTVEKQFEQVAHLPLVEI